MHRLVLKDRITTFWFSRGGVVLARSILLLISAIFLVQVYGKAYREGGYDFTSYLLSSRALLDGTSPYQTGSPFPFIYPLFICAVLIPLTYVPYWLSNVFWFLGNIVALYYSAVVLLRHYAPNLSQKDIAVIAVVPFLVLLGVIQNNVLNGQVNFIVLLLCVLFLRDYRLDRRLSASLFLSAAIAIKLTPLVFLVYLLFRRDILMLGSVLLGSLTLVFVIPYAIGGAATMDYYTFYVDSVLKANLTSNTLVDGAAYSMTSIIGSVAPSMPKLNAFIIAGLIALTPIAWIEFSSRGERWAGKDVSIFALYMLAVLLMSPVSETHHLINLLPALLLMVVAMATHSERHFNVGAVVLAFVMASSILGKFYLVANCAAICTLYYSTVRLIRSGPASGQSR